jgi:hypothetical protein
MQWQGVPAAHAIALHNDVKFGYEEQAHAEDFFLPYLWTIVYDSAKIVWYNAAGVRMFSVAAHKVCIHILGGNSLCLWFHLHVTWN